MMQLVLDFFIWSFLGKLIRSIVKISIIPKESLNEYLAYLETMWHFDRPCLFKTIYFNLRLCSVRQALRCPIYVYGKTRMWSLKGNVVIETRKITPGMVKWGYDWGYRSNGTTIIRIEGNIHFGGTCLIAKGSDIAVFKGGGLFIGSGGNILENTLIYCCEEIRIGRNFSFAFQSSMMDSDFHYMLDLSKNRIAKRTSPIRIGDNVWVGNRATIKKGVKIPNNTIIAASYSVLTKDYTQLPPYSIIGGCPAKLLSFGYSRIWKNEMDNARIIDTYFEKYPKVDFFLINSKEQSRYIYEC